ncbi:MAG: c-type cytochrome [Fuerstiella sp.]
MMIPELHPVVARLLLTAVLLLAGRVTTIVPCCAQGLSPEESVSRMKSAAGFEVSVVAAEPLVRQPVAIEFDDRGRLWVIQYLQYPNPEGLKRIDVDRYSRTKYDRVPKPPPHGPRGADRITILEDADGDGRMDHGRDFVTGLNLATGMAFGHGGVFVLNVPYLLFYPDRDRDDVPDSDPEVLLTGFGMEDAHSVANSLTWGPDGWLYGCQGSTVTAQIRGVTFQQGVWRYHPVTRRFELFCEGGGNSWGLDFDRTGNLFYSTNYGGYVLLHGVQGGYFVKSFAKHGELQNPHAYGYFQHAPHQNFRGGHVTVGGIIYQEDSFPDEFRGTCIAGDLLGHGVYWHRIESQGSTVRTVHGGELLQSDDPWFAPTDVTTGPDGAVYVSDWHDARTAHPDPDADWDRSNGRIYRIAATGTEAAAPLDFASRSTSELISLHSHPSQWYVRRARMELARRSRQESPPLFDAAAVRQQLAQQATTATEEGRALESLWSLSVIGGFDESIAGQTLESPHPAVRLWTVRLLGDGGRVSDDMAHRLDDLAEQEPDVHVRQQLACMAQRLPADQAVPVINANINRDIDNDDLYLPLLWWWATERHSVSGREEVLRRFVRPTLWQSQLGRDFLLPRLVRRYAAEGTNDGLTSVATLLQAAPDDQARSVLWSAVLQGWNELSHAVATSDPAMMAQPHEFSRMVRQAWDSDPTDPVLTDLAVRINYPRAFDMASRRAFDQSEEPGQRARLLDILARTQTASLVAPALQLVQSDQPGIVQQAALRIAARFDDPDVATGLIELLTDSVRAALHPQIREILLARPSSARLLLAAVERGDISPEEIPLEQVRQVALYNDEQLNQLVARHWGRLRPATPGEKLAEVRRLNNDLRAGSGDAAAGKSLFTKHCGTCHRLFGEGTKLGPDLTTANRQDSQFLLISLVDPNSVIRKEYVSVIVHTTDGRVLTGLPIERDDSAVTLLDGKKPQPAVIARSEIAEIHESAVSLMPDNLYRQFSPQQLRDLFRYLQSNSAP